MRISRQSEISSFAMVMMGPNCGENAITVIRRFDGVDDDTADCLADLKRSGELGTSDLNRLENALDSGGIDGRDLRRVSKLYDSETDEYFVGSDTEVEDILEISDRGGDLDQTEAVVVRGGSVRWIQQGSRARGWQKVQRKHIYGDLDSSDSRSSFFETGQRINLGGRTVTLNNDRSVNGVKTLVMRTLKRGNQPEPNADPGKWEWSPSGSDTRVRVIIDSDGRVVTAYRVDSNAPEYTRSNGWDNV